MNLCHPVVCSSVTALRAIIFPKSQVGHPASCYFIRIIWKWNYVHNWTVLVQQTMLSALHSFLTTPYYCTISIVIGYGLDNRGVGVRVPVEARIFSSPCHPNGLWGSLSLLFNVYWGSFLRGKVAGVWSWLLTSN
jgi:hypothetical protein